MNSNTYKTVLRVFQNWPVDPLKAGGRDLGEHLRAQVSHYFNISRAGKLKLNEWDQINQILIRIDSDKYQKLFEVTRKVTASGISPELCAKATSTEYLKYLEKGDITFREKLSNFFGAVGDMITSASQPKKNPEKP